MKPTVRIANSSHVVVLNIYLQEENICLLSRRRAWPWVENANNSCGALILSQIDSRHARVKYCSGEFRWAMANGGAI